LILNCGRSSHYLAASEQQVGRDRIHQYWEQREPAFVGAAILYPVTTERVQPRRTAPLLDPYRTAFD
jgi:hypothetical protein